MFVCIALLLLNYSSLNAQYSDSTYRKKEVFLQVDTFTTKKRFWRASGELFVCQLIPWSYNYFVRDADFARISFSSIGHNMEPSRWEWDDNSFKTNQFAHPYHGNLYFSSFRSNGYSFWESAPAAFAGSLMWEIAGETHNPAPNDFINTSLGGISLGEITYRLSNSIVDNKQRGFGRQAREVLALLVNPVNGLNRILDGRWGRVHHDRSDSVHIPISAVLDVGMRRFSERSSDFIEKGNNEFFMRLRLQYGKYNAVSRIPFNNFSVLLEAGASDSASLNMLLVNGALSQWQLPIDKGGQHIASVTMNYDYFKNNSFEYGAQSFNFKVLSDWKKIDKVKINTMLGAGIIVLAAVPDPYLYYGEGRNYDYGPGVSVTGSANVDFNDKVICALNYRGGWFKTVNGNTSSFFLNAVTVETRYQFAKRFSVAAEVGHFTLDGNFAHYDNIFRRYPYIRLSLGCKLFDLLPAL
ncbi:MAG: DUF3943 domain-containing protein [Chitinophagaceae bacterium]